MINIFRHLGGTRLALAGMILLLAGALTNLRFSADWLINVPLTLLFVNLLMALIFNAACKRTTLLLAFHMCLLLLLGLAALGRYMHFEGKVELVEGLTLEPDIIETDKQGGWHRATLGDMNIVQGPFSVEYSPGNYRQKTRSQLSLETAGGVKKEIIAGDDKPVLIEGYRFYATSNKGFSVILGWSSLEGDRLLGTVNFPSFPALEWGQRQHWVTPAGQGLGLRLSTNKSSDLEESWVLHGEGLLAELDIKSENISALISPGEKIMLKGGELEFVDARMWMGYKISYNPLLPWLFATASIAVLLMMIHMFREERSRPGTNKNT